MNFSNRVLQVTKDAIEPYVIEQIAGKFAARKYVAWRDSKEYAQALKEATAMNGMLRLTDKRTRGYKHLQSVYETWCKQYEKDYPELPEERRVNFAKIIGIRAV